MPRPTDPQSFAGRIRQCFTDGRPFVAYEAPSHVQPAAVAARLAAQIARLRPQIYQVRRAARGSVDPAEYDRAFPGDAGSACVVWSDADLACVFIGPRPPEHGPRRIRSIDGRFELKPGESALITLHHRGVRDTNAWLRSKSDLHFRATGVFPVFTAELPDGRDPGPLTRRTDYLITRHADRTDRTDPGPARPEWAALQPRGPDALDQARMDELRKLLQKRKPLSPEGFRSAVEELAQLVREQEARRATEAQRASEPNTPAPQST